MRLGPKEKEILLRLIPGDFVPPSVYLGNTPCEGHSLCGLLNNRSLHRIVYEKKLAIFRYQTLTREEVFEGIATRALRPGRQAAEYNAALRPTPRGCEIIENLKAQEDPRIIQELAQAQNVKPLTDVRSLMGTWPGEVDDGFEEAIDELRHSHGPQAQD
jgi:hypothetical protein